MLTLDKHLKLTKEVIESANLCDRFSDEDLGKIGEYVWENYTADVQSRIQWMTRTEAAMDLAMQIQKDKSFPWPGCSNIAFPLVTIAALQFHSRAYPTIVQGDDVVKCKVIGPDPDGSKSERCERVEDYMSWQLTTQDENWETDTDKSLINVPIVGIAWKKSHFGTELNCPTSELVLAKDLIINYWAKDRDPSSVKTHVIPFSRNKIYSRIASGMFRDVREESWYQEDAPQPEQSTQIENAENRSGIRMPMPDSRTPFIILEQHCNIDLDGDGYAEPLIVTFEQSTHCVLRIVCRFDSVDDIQKNAKGEIITINSTEYFTKIPFLPNPDGSIMDIGFGVLLGPLNESVNSAINQLFDAGTISNTAGGFLGRGAKIRGGVYNFSPFDWNRIDSTGDDIRKSVIPLPVREPSNVMFQLLSLLITYTEKISGAVDITTGGNPGQNTPAQTSQTMVEQGQKVYAAIFKRIWKSLREEFRKIYKLNAINLPNGPITWAGSDKYITRQDFLEPVNAITPIADPNILSDQARFAQARLLKEAANNNPAYDRDAVEIRFLKAIKISDIPTIYKGVKSLPPPTPTEKVQIEQLKVQVQMEKLKWEKLQYISSLLEQRRLNEAKIISLYAEAALAESQAGGVESANSIALFQAKIDGLKTLNDMISNQVSSIGDPSNANQGGNTDANAGDGQGTIPGMEGPSSNGTSNGIPQTSQAGADGTMG